MFAMDKVSDNASPRDIYKFASLWFGGLLIFLLLTNFHWTVILMLAFGVIVSGLYAVKVKDVYLCDDYLRIKNGQSFVNIKLEDIIEIENSSYLKGCYRINFADRTALGTHILFTPRVEKFEPHEVLNNLIKKVNSI
jgi:hypothetical protein